MLTSILIWLISSFIVSGVPLQVRVGGEQIQHPATNRERGITYRAKWERRDKIDYKVDIRERSAHNSNEVWR